jgi:glutamate/tyrosine decarboxylase-like PLP-dependent enzyme
VKLSNINGEAGPALRRVAAYAARFRAETTNLEPSADAQTLRGQFRIDLPEQAQPVGTVIRRLIEAAEPGLVGSTKPGFLSWVIGASHEAGVAADWLTSAWGQNAGLYQTSPAAAECEQAVAGWLLDLLDLPRDGAVGFVTGATMATFTCLAAARSEVLRRIGYDLNFRGLQGAPMINVVIGEDAHVTNFAALRYLGFGEANFLRVEPDRNGLMQVHALERLAETLTGPTIVIAQAGHINSGGFDDFSAAAKLARRLGGWLHVDGAFGLWARASSRFSALAEGAQLADSWSVDGHKWLQLPYDSGFAIVRDALALQRAMRKTASYLNESADDGRNPSAYVPELSRRARGFAPWALLQSLGRSGVARLVDANCDGASLFASRCAEVPGATVLNDVVLNQVAVTFGDRTQQICDALNATGRFFLRTAVWRNQPILRASFCGHSCAEETARELADAIAALGK